MVFVLIAIFFLDSYRYCGVLSHFVIILSWAAAAIISFAASMPISATGWRIWYLASIFVLGHSGVPVAETVTMSLLVGVCSTLLIVGLVPLMMRSDRLGKMGMSEADRAHGVAEIEISAV
jgi:hypothetical protein